MSKAIIIIVFGALLILCVAAQIISTNTRFAPDQTLTQQQRNYYYIH